MDSTRDKLLVVAIVVLPFIGAVLAYQFGNSLVNETERNKKKDSLPPSSPKSDKKKN